MLFNFYGTQDRLRSSDIVGGLKLPDTRTELRVEGKLGFFNSATTILTEQILVGISTIKLFFEKRF